MKDRIFLPLDESKQEIRLLTIEVTGDDCLVRCSVSTFSLDRCPKFWVLSYVWGNPKVTDTIIVNDRALQATTNLIDFLKEYRSSLYEESWMRAVGGIASFEPVRIWIDSLCINQDDIRERNNQVLLMKRIYGQAEKSIAWLGKEEQGSGLVLQTINTLVPIIFKDKVPSSQKEVYERLCRIIFEQEFSMAPFNFFWDSVIKFMQRAYWRRVWTFQEMIIPQFTQIVCGSDDCPLSHFMHFPVWLREITSSRFLSAMDRYMWDYLRSTMQSVMSPISRVLEMYVAFHNISNLRHKLAYKAWEIVTTTRYLQASDPRDYIYAFLGVIDLPIRPDYGLAESQVFLDSARIGISEGHVEEILCSAITVSGLPALCPLTWVPAWAKMSEPQGLFMQYLLSVIKTYEANSSTNFKPESPMLGSDGSLILTGVTVSTVFYVGICPEISSTDFFPKIRDIYNHLVSVSRYSSSSYMLGIVFRTLLGDSKPGSETRHHQEAFRDEDHFMILLMAVLCIRDGPCYKLDETVYQERLNSLGLPFDERFGSAFQMATQGSFSTEYSRFSGMTAEQAFNRTRSNEIEHETIEQIHWTWKSRFFITNSNCLGLGTMGTKIGDTIVVTKQCKFPLILRKRPSGSGYHFVGPCFMLGMMNGEAFEGTHGEERFEIY